MLPNHIQTLIARFSKLPGIGPRQAARFAFFLLRNKDEFQNLITDLNLVNENIDLCGECYLPCFRETAGAGPANIKLCSICSNPVRDKNTICVIEKETDAMNMEKTGYFKGRYYVLGGFINPLHGDSTARKRADFFVKKIKISISSGYDPDESPPLRPSPPYKGEGLRGDPDEFEIILALTPRREGDFTSHYIEEKLKPLQKEGRNIKVSRLGRGLSSGAELEYADEETLKNAFDGRK